MEKMARYRLLNSSPEVVYDLLKRHYEYSCRSRRWHNDMTDVASMNLSLYEYEGVNLNETEAELFKISNPLINLALAQYGSNEGVLDVLYNSNDSEIFRLACVKNSLYINNKLSNPHNIGGKEKYNIFMKSLSYKELIYLIENPALPKLALINLYSKTDIFEALTEDEWHWLIQQSTQNPSIDSYLNGLSFSIHEDEQADLNILAWMLLDNDHVTQKWVVTLVRLLKNSSPPEGLPYSIWLKKWRSSDPSEERKFLDLRILFVQKAYDYVFPYNDEMGNLKKLSSSNDLALRCAYYNTFIFNDPYFVRKGYEMDDLDFLEYACKNPHLYDWSASAFSQLEYFIMPHDNDEEYGNDLKKNWTIYKSNEDKLYAILRGTERLDELREWIVQGGVNPKFTLLEIAAIIYLATVAYSVITHIF